MYTVCRYDTPQWTSQTGWTWNRTGNSQKSWTTYLFRRNDETYSTCISCKRITFISSFMPQTLYFHVFRRIQGKTLNFCEKTFGHKNTPTPLTLMSCHNYAIFSKYFSLLGALNVRVWFKHKHLAVNYAFPIPQAVKIWADWIGDCPRSFDQFEKPFLIKGVLDNERYLSMSYNCPLKLTVKTLTRCCISQSLGPVPTVSVSLKQSVVYFFCLTISRICLKREKKSHMLNVPMILCPTFFSIFDIYISLL